MNHFNENKAVGQLSELLALEYGYTPEKAKQIYIAASLHDIGKIAVSSSILNKPGKLTAGEFTIIKNHTKLGASMLSVVQGELGKIAKQIALNHHEWANPSLGGYWGVDINTLSDYISFTAISDVYTALVSDNRPYKTAWTQKDALTYIQNQAERQFSPALVERFINLIQNDSRVAVIFKQ